MMKYIGILSVVFLAGCAAKQQAEDFHSSVNSFRGQSADSVITALGAPDSRAETSGGEVFTYRGEAEGFPDYTFRCRIDFEITDGKIAEVSYRGRGNHPYHGDSENCGQVYGGL